MCGPGCGVSILGHFAQLYPGLGNLLKPENLAQTVEGMAVQIATNFPVNPWDIAQGWDTPGVSSFPGSSSENLGEGIKEFLESHGFNDSSYSVTDNPASMVNEIMTNTPKRGSAVILCLEKGQGTDRQWHFVTVCGWEYLSSTGQWKLKIMDPLSELTWDPNPGWVWFSSQDSKYVLIDVDSETSVWRFYKAITIKIPEPACLLLLGTGMLLVLHRKRARR